MSLFKHKIIDHVRDIVCTILLSLFFTNFFFYVCIAKLKRTAFDHLICVFRKYGGIKLIAILTFCDVVQ